MRFILVLALASACVAQQIDFLKQVDNTPTYISSKYSWSRTNGAGASASLTSTGSKTITVTPCPKGVWGSGADHYVYISGGSGTAETALITGGSCTTGANTGTIIVTTANTHSGSWTVGSATAGIQEAVKIAENTGQASSVTIPCGRHTIYAPIRIRVTEIGVAAASDYCATVDASNMATGNVFEFHAASGTFNDTSIRGLRIYASSKTSGAGVSVDTAQNFHADKLVITNIPDGIVFHASYLVHVSNVNISGIKATTGRGISYDGGANLRIFSTQIGGSVPSPPLAGIEILDGGGIWITDTDVISCGKDLYVHPGAGKSASAGFVSNSSFDTADYGIYFAPTSTGTAYYWNFSNSWSASHSQAGVYATAPAASQLDGLSFVNHRSVNNQVWGFKIAAAQNVNISDSQVWGNSQSGSGVAAAVQIDANLSHIKLTGNTFTPPGGYPKNHAAHISVDAGTGDYYTITNNDLSDTITLAPILFSATGTHQVIQSNVGVNTFTPTLTAATTLSLGIPSSFYVISGATAITTIQNGWEGREITLLNTGGSSVQLNTGGNITAALTIVSGGSGTCRYGNGGWWCK